MSQRMPDYDAYRAREKESTQGGIWTMTDDEFNRELAKAWFEGVMSQFEADLLGKSPTRNPYEPKP